MMKIIVEIVNQDDMRVKGQIGDYFYSLDGTLVFRIAEMRENYLTKLILLHELGEQLMTECKGIKEEEITAFDVAHPESEEQGLEKDAPYRDEHLIMEAIERLIIAHLGISWKQYEEELC